MKQEGAAERERGDLMDCPIGGIPHALEKLFNARFRVELPDGEIFHSLGETHILFEQWRVHYNTVRPHSALGYRPPAPECTVPM